MATAQNNPLNTVLYVLNATLSINGDERKQAEVYLKQLGDQPGFGISLTQLALEAQVPLHLRQAASIALKKYVHDHWKPDETEEEMESDFTNDNATILQQQQTQQQQPKQPEPLKVEVGAEEKKLIRDLLPRGLADESSQIRTGLGMCIAQIAQWDWPNEWPSILEHLAVSLQSTNLNLVQGCARCLELFVEGENLSSEALPTLFRILFPQILAVMRSNLPDQTKARIVSVGAGLLNWLSILKANHKQDTLAFFSTVAPNWIEFFSLVLNQPDSPTSPSALKIAVLKALVLMTGKFAKHMKPFVPKLIEPVWNSLVNGFEIYSKMAISQDLQAPQDEEGEVLGFPSVVNHIWEFLHCILESEHLLSILKSHLTALLYIGIGYVQITLDQEELYLSDPNQFVADDNDEAYNYSVRMSANNFLSNLIEEYAEEGIAGMKTAVLKRLQETQSPGPNVWKLREATIVSVAWSADLLVAFPSQFDCNEFVSLILGDLKQRSYPILTGSAIWCAGRFAQHIKPQLCGEIALTCLANLAEPTVPLPVKYNCCRALVSVCPILEKEKDQVISNALPLVATLAAAANEETLSLVLETLNAFFKISPNSAAQHAPLVSQFLLQIWAKTVTFGHLSQLLTDMVDKMLAIPSCWQEVMSKLSQPISTVLRDSHDIPGLTESSLSIVHVSFTHITKQNEQGYLELISVWFPLICNRLARSEDALIIQECTGALAALVEHAPHTIQRLQDGVGSLMKVMEKLLGSQLSDHAVLEAGHFVSSLLKQLSPVLGGAVVGDILKLVIRRLANARLPSLIQSLVMIFARLAQTGTNNIIDFLSTFEVPVKTDNDSAWNDGTVADGQYNLSALFVLLSIWTRWHEEFKGAFWLKLSMVGLCSLFQCPNPKLSNLNIPGELAVNLSDDTIITRSKAKQQHSNNNNNNNAQNKPKHPLISIRVRIIQLMAREFKAMSESANGNGDDEDDMNEFLEMLTGGNTFLDSSQLDLDALEDEAEQEDQEILNDPLYPLDLQKYISDFFQAFARADQNTFVSMASQLPRVDQEIIQSIITVPSPRR